MSGYFSFQKLITTTIVKAVYFLGFIILSTLSITLIVWAGLRLHDANIARQLGWRYVAVGTAGLIIGNIVWRVICEFWMVLFSVLFISPAIANVCPSCSSTSVSARRVVRAGSRKPFRLYTPVIRLTCSK